MLTGQEDKNTKYNKRFRNSLIVRTLGCIALGLFIGLYIGGADVTSITTLHTSIQSNLIDYQKVLACLIIGFIGALFADLYAYMDYEKYKNTRMGEEHGTSKLLTEKELPNFNKQFFYDPIIVKKHYPKVKTQYDAENLKKICVKIPKAKKIWNDCFINSQIIGQDIYLSMNTKFINRNLNTLTIGTAGQGKSYSELFPNTLSANSNYIFTDPSGEILQKTGKFLESQGYVLKIFNVDEFCLSQKYNPIAYIKTEKDYNTLVDALVENINMGKQSSGNDFFEKAAKSLDCALIALLRELYPTDPQLITEKRIEEIRNKVDENDNYIYQDKTDEELLEITIQENMAMQTFSNVMNLLRMAKQEVDESGMTSSVLDDMFAKLQENNPRSYATKMWKTFQAGGQKVCNEVIISSAADFGRYFDNPEIAWLTSKDELKLEEIASEEKCALFLIIPQATKSYNFLCSMIYSQLFDIAMKAGKKWRDDHDLENPTLPRHLSLWLDEFANIGKIPNFLELLSTVRKYNISINIIIQAMSQLKSSYPKDEWETILGNLDTMIYLGGMEPTTVKWLSEKLGKETIKQLNITYSKQGTQNASVIGRNILDPNEIEQMSRSNELIFISGCKPIKTRKYDLSKHPNFKYSGEADKKNNFNINKYFQNNEVDLDYLDEYALLEYDVQNFDYEMLVKPNIKNRRKNQNPITVTSPQEENDSHIQEMIDAVNSNTDLSEEEKAERIKEIKSWKSNQDLDLSTVIETYGEINYEIYSTNSNSEFELAVNLSVEDFEGLEIEKK